MSERSLCFRRKSSGSATVMSLHKRGVGMSHSPGVPRAHFMPGTCSSTGAAHNMDGMAQQHHEYRHGAALHSQRHVTCRLTEHATWSSLVRAWPGCLLCQRGASCLRTWRTSYEGVGNRSAVGCHHVYTDLMSKCETGGTVARHWIQCKPGEAAPLEDAPPSSAPLPLCCPPAACCLRPSHWRVSYRCLSPADRPTWWLHIAQRCHSVL